MFEKREKIRVTLTKQDKIPLNKSLTRYLDEISQIWKDEKNSHIFNKKLELFITQVGKDSDISWNLLGTRLETDEEYNERILMLAQNEQEKKQRNIKLIKRLMEESKLTPSDLEMFESHNPENHFHVSDVGEPTPGVQI